MNSVLVVLETVAGKLRPACLSGITCAQQIAHHRAVELHLLILGKEPSSVARDIAANGYGASTLHTMAHAALEPFTAEAWATAIGHAALTVGANVIGGAASSTLRDVLPRVAAMLDAPLVPEVVNVKNADTFTRPIAAGRALLDVKVQAPTVCFTARATEFAPAVPSGEASVASLAPPPQLGNLGATVVSLETTQSARPALGEAKVVVSGGRGMRESANFKILEQLTDLLGGALGASRAATDAGLVPSDLQVGQTGKIVAPELYIAVAISGAIQHLAGMKGSKVIVAINKDPEAPIFQLADYGLVAKWEDAVPRLIELIRAHKQHG